MNDLAKGAGIAPPLPTAAIPDDAYVSPGFRAWADRGAVLAKRWTDLTWETCRWAWEGMRDHRAEIEQFKDDPMWGLSGSTIEKYALIWERYRERKDLRDLGLAVSLYDVAKGITDTKKRDRLLHQAAEEGWSRNDLTREMGWPSARPNGRVEVADERPPDVAAWEDGARAMAGALGLTEPTAEAVLDWIAVYAGPMLQREIARRWRDAK